MNVYKWGLKDSFKIYTENTRILAFIICDVNWTYAARCKTVEFDVSYCFESEEFVVEDIM